MSAAPKIDPAYTVDDFLTFARSTDQRVEYFDGDIRAMATESGSHADVSTNVVAILHRQLVGKPCRARTKDSMVRSGPTPLPGQGTRGLFSLPDIVVICGEPEYHDAHGDVILNPTVIVEVLSPSTEAIDRGAKFERDRDWNPTLKEYLLVAQDQARIEHHIRKEDGKWEMQDVIGLHQVVNLPSIGCQLPMREVYDRVIATEADA